MDSLNVEELMRPFDGSQVRQRIGPGRKSLDYISGPDVIRRLLDATGNHFTWNVERVQMVIQDTANGGSASLWIVQGTLTVDTLGSRSGVGTHPADSVEAAKAAETDALKRAALKFGVGLHLYEDDPSSAGAAQPPSPAPPQASGGRNGGAGGGSYERPTPDAQNANGGNGYNRNSGGSGNGGYGSGGYSGSRRSHSPSYEGSPDPNGVGSNAPF